MKKTAEITTDKMLDSREIEERIDELEGQEEKDEEETAELAALTAFREEVSQYSNEWPHSSSPGQRPVHSSGPPSFSMVASKASYISVVGPLW